MRISILIALAVLLAAPVVVAAEPQRDGRQGVERPASPQRPVVQRPTAPDPDVEDAADRRTVRTQSGTEPQQTPSPGQAVVQPTCNFVRNLTRTTTRFCPDGSSITEQEECTQAGSGIYPNCQIRENCLVVSDATCPPTQTQTPGD